MIVGHPSAKAFLALLALLIIPLCSPATLAQDDPANGETDPIKLFERGQDAHAKNDYKKAIELYDAAIKIKPEFPEAEFQRAMALLVTDHKTEAIEGFNRAIALRADWQFAYANFGIELAKSSSAAAEPILRKAYQLDDHDLKVTVAFALALSHMGRHPEAVKTIRAATSLKDATADTWQMRAIIEAADETEAALSSITHAIEIGPGTPSMHRDRARLLLAKKDQAAAIVELDAAKALLTPKTPGRQLEVIFDVASLYGRLGKPAEGVSLLDALDDKYRNDPMFVELRAALAVDAGAAQPEDMVALEAALQRDPKNASLLARLGGAYRRVDPVKSEDYYFRALQIEPKNTKYAIGYAGALVQERKFAQAETVLRRVLAVTSDDYTAHANLALALYEMKRFAEALPEYEWLAKAKPEIPATYFFIATAHDNLAQYPEALDAYQKFLAHADPATNKLEIDKVNLRLPALRAQIQRGQGVKRKNP